MEYRLDENQVLTMRLRKKEAALAAPVEFSVENPLSHVVNPIRAEIEAEQLEQAIGPGCKLSPEERSAKAWRLATVLGDLGQREKSLAVLRALQREKARPDTWLLNQMGLMLDELNASEQAERAYRDAADADRRIGAPLFNLALMLRRRRLIERAIAATDEGLVREPQGPYYALRALLANDADDDRTRDEMVAAALRNFGAPKGLSDWELCWFGRAAELAGDEQRLNAWRSERRRRQQSAPTLAGDLPIRRSEV